MKERYWLTPPDLYKQLDNEFHFNFDPCPHPRPDGFDGLKVEWGSSNYVNPPFNSSTVPWGRKCIEEAKLGKTVVYMKPAWAEIHDLVEAGAALRALGRVKWVSIESGRTQRRPSFKIIGYVFNPPGPKPSFIMNNKGGEGL